MVSDRAGLEGGFEEVKVEEEVAVGLEVEREDGEEVGLEVDAEVVEEVVDRGEEEWEREEKSLDLVFLWSLF